MGDDEPVEGAGAGGEPGGDHVVDDVRHAGGVATPGALHQLLHEGEPEASLDSGHRDSQRRRRGGGGGGG